MRLLLCRISDTEQALVLSFLFSMTPHGSAGGAAEVLWALFSKTGFVTVGAGWGESLKAVLKIPSLKMDVCFSLQGSCTLADNLGFQDNYLFFFFLT